MSGLFEELDYRPTGMGVLSLRRRRDLARNIDVYEIKLGDEFLMSSAFTASETALAKLALAALPQERLDILVGGLGLGYTAKATLDDARVDTLTVIEMMPEVIEWHQTGLVPLGSVLSSLLVVSRLVPAALLKRPTAAISCAAFGHSHDIV